MNPPLPKRRHTRLELPQRTPATRPDAEDQAEEVRESASFLDAVLGQTWTDAVPAAPAGDTAALAVSVRRWMTEAGAETDRGPATEPSAAAEQADDPALPGPPSLQQVPTADRATVHERPEQPAPSTRHRVAVLIAADGFEADDVPALLADITRRYGRPAITRLYVDWTAAEGIGAWSHAIGEHGVQPIHTMSPGRGATSVALSLDALDAVYHHGITRVIVVGTLDGIQPLLTRLRAGGTHVVTTEPARGAGEPRQFGDGYIQLNPTGGHERLSTAADHRRQPGRPPGRHRRE